MTEPVILNVTYQGESKNLPQPIHSDTSDEDIRRIGAESLELPPGTFDLFVVDRFPETGHFYLRPKVPFGSTPTPVVHHKVYLLHEDESWAMAIFPVPTPDKACLNQLKMNRKDTSDPFEVIRAYYSGTVQYSEIIKFVDAGLPDEDDFEAYGIEDV